MPLLQADFTAGLVNYVSDQIRAVLADHPVNLERVQQGKRPASVVLLRGAGMRLRLPSFEERHGLKACIVSPTKILGGMLPVAPPVSHHARENFGTVRESNAPKFIACSCPRHERGHLFPASIAAVPSYPALAHQWANIPPTTTAMPPSSICTQNPVMQARAWLRASLLPNTEALP